MQTRYLIIGNSAGGLGAAESIRQVENAKLDASSNMVNVIEELANKLPRMDSERVAFGFLGIVRDLATRIGEDERSAIQLLRALRVFMQQPADEGPLIAPATASGSYRATPPGIPPQVPPAEDDNGAAPDQED